MKNKSCNQVSDEYDAGPSGSEQEDKVQPIDETRVVRELKRGINLEENYRWLFDRYYRHLVYFFGMRGVTLEESRDLAQETFVAVIKGIKKYKQESSFKTWILRIAINIMSNKRRDEAASKRIQSPVSLETMGNPACSVDTLYEDTADPGPESRYFAKEAAHQLRQALLELPPQMCNCVLLRVYQGRKYREIAVLLNISVLTVKSHLYQAKEKLREKLGEYVDTISLEEGEDDG